jgi:DEAD/DEAH box helicase domain-containing protein
VIPWVVAREIRATLLDYLRSTWSIADRQVREALFSFLDGPHGLFQGPYLRLGLPFAPCPPDAALPLEILPPHTPHLHQLQAWQRLSSRGQSPRATLITTGTGSGKTECFLYPILDHTLREVLAGRPGIKAIVLYPMNALAADQAQRFAETIWSEERLRGRIRVGLFIGGEGAHGEMGRDHVVDNNEKLRHNPPDVLLTNYRMLDLLLQRPSDAELWRRNGPDTLRYLVLDELHTYDGAQGTDVACLIRRLGHRLGSSEAICPVGTSATVGGGEDTRGELLRFAATLFDQAFPPDAFVGETRLEPRDLLPAAALPEGYPPEAGPWPQPGESAEHHVRSVVRAWLPPRAQAEILLASGDGAGEGAIGGIDRLALGRWVLGLPIARALVAVAHQRPRSPGELDRALAAGLPGFAAGSEAHRQGWLASALSMISFAQRPVGTHALPLVNVQATLWVREVRRLLSRVGGPPAFRFHDDAPPPPDEAWLPRYTCSDCGHGGWLVTESGPGDTLDLRYAEIARAFLEKSPNLRLLHDDTRLAGEHEQATDETVRVGWLDSREARLLDKAADPASPAPRVHVFAPEGNKVRCPGCGNDGLRLLAARSTTLSSVAVGHLFTTPLNTDRKLLAFSDSVQDAAHRAGFFGARTYRFALRTALLAGVPAVGRVPLAALGPATWSHWIGKLGEQVRRPGLSAQAELTALILPVDLHWLASVESWHAQLDEFVRARQSAAEAGEHAPGTVPEPGAALLEEVKVRLRWECTRELGVASRIGRTLEQSGCLSVTLEEARFAAAVTDAEVTLRERVGSSLPPEALAVCVAGLLTRLRLRGGVLDPLLEPYLRSGGDDFMLSRAKAPLLSPFPRETSRPVFLTSAPKPKRFDSVTPARAGTWVVDWLARSLGQPPEPGLATEVYAVLLPILVRHALLGAFATDERGTSPGSKATAWGLLPEALEVSRAHVARRCDACGTEVAAVEGSVTDPRDWPCLRFRCAGRLRAFSDAAGAGADLPVASYYRRFYEREQLGRLWSREHTGLLERGAREELELEFKQRPRPDSPNLLSCTPTLEMGIDIGDLSATLLCSVPPAPARYIQRVGRAGRKTGNALVLAFAATRPHDLYFFQEPLEAMAGAVHPPGCYLSAPEVLKRQALAFMFDAFAREGGKLAGRVGDALKGEHAKRFPEALFEFIGPRRERLRLAFIEMFRGELTTSAQVRLAEELTAGADGLSPVENGLLRTTNQARARRDDLRRLAQKLDERLRQLASDEVEAKKVADLEDEIARLRDERKFVQQQLMTMLEQPLWGWLCEESRLPNYAFPERGVKLDAFIRREGVGREPEHHTWVRPPAAALTELAPWNTFYASARRVQVSGIELGRESTPVSWRFCQSCHHAEVDSRAETPVERCPDCGDGHWGDIGQQRDVLALGQVFAIAQHRDAVLGDDGDDRDRHYYQRVALFEADATPRDSWSNDGAGFGFELQPQMVLRQLNLGPTDSARSPQQAQIAGQTVPDVCFTICPTCGYARDPGGPQSAPSGRPFDRHRAWCPERRKPVDRQPSRELHLLRELTSEALRLVVPFVASETMASELANLRAALRLGLRRFYGGDPDFLEVGAYHEPLPGREGRRHYLVIMDRVPGGTGLLAELCKDRGAKLKEALEKAHDTLRACPCQRRDPAVKGCYQCLYAYREHDNLPLLDRTRALELLERLIDAFGSLTRVDTIGTMTQSQVLESELEARFVTVLAQRVKDAGGSWLESDDGTWTLKLGARGWLMRAQVELGADRVAIPCRADFVLYPEDHPGVAARAVAVFTDGLAYHVMPGAPDSRLADDARKRLGVSQGGQMLSWSMTWKDVVSPDSPALPRWTGDGTVVAQLQTMASRLDAGKGSPERLENAIHMVHADPLRGLLAYLEAPSCLDGLARLTAFLLLQGGRRQPAARVAGAQTRWRSDAEAPDLPLVESEGDVAVFLRKLGGHARLLVDVEAVRLATLLADPAPVTLTLRLEEGGEARSAPAFEQSWRLWLRAWNLLQALPGAMVLTSASGLRTDERISSRQEALDGDTLPAGAPGASTNSRAAVAAEILDPDAARVVLQLLLDHPELAVPSVPLELRMAIDGIDGDLEVGWRERHVAAYLDNQAPVAERLRADGWTVLPIERKLDLAVLERALGLSKGTGGNGTARDQ